MWVLATGAPAEVEKAEPPDWLEPLVNASGLAFQVRQIPALIQASLLHAETEWGDVAPEARAAMTLAVNWAFSAERLLEDVRENMQSAIDETTAQASLRWLTSPAGQRITRAEEKASTPKAQKAMAEEAETMERASERGELLSRLMHAVEAPKHQLDFIFQVQRAIMLGLDPRNLSAAEQMENQYRKNRSILEAMMEEQILSSFFYTYRGVEADDIEPYIAFSLSREGQAYHEAAMRALTLALRNAGTRMGERLAQLAVEATH